MKSRGFVDNLNSNNLQEHRSSMAASDIAAATLSSFNNTKFYIHSQRDEFFKRGVNVRSTVSCDETKSKDGRTTRIVEASSINGVNPLELDADIAHFKVECPIL